MATKAQRNYLDEVYNLAIAVGIPEVQARLAATQSAHETNYGKSAPGNAYFGMKAGSSWSGPTQEFATHEEVGGKNVSTRDKFRVYDSKEASLLDWYDRLQKRWPDAAGATDFDTAVAGLRAGKKGGYATDSKYASKLASVSNGLAPRPPGYVPDVATSTDTASSALDRLFGGGENTPSAMAYADTGGLGFDPLPVPKPLTPTKPVSSNPTLSSAMNSTGAPAAFGVRSNSPYSVKVPKLPTANFSGFDTSSPYTTVKDATGQRSPVSLMSMAVPQATPLRSARPTTQRQPAPMAPAQALKQNTGVLGLGNGVGFGPQWGTLDTLKQIAAPKVDPIGAGPGSYATYTGLLNDMVGTKSALGGLSVPVGGIAGAIPPAVPPQPSPAPTPSQPRQNVTPLQQALAERGFNPGPVDGVNGPQTKAAIMAFQKANGLAVDGIVGPKTIAALNGKSAPSPMPTRPQTPYMTSPSYMTTPGSPFANPPAPTGGGFDLGAMFGGLGTKANELIEGAKTGIGNTLNTATTAVQKTANNTADLMKNELMGTVGGRTLPLNTLMGSKGTIYNNPGKYGATSADRQEAAARRAALSQGIPYVPASTGVRTQLSVPSVPNKPQKRQLTRAERFTNLDPWGNIL